MMKNVQQIKNPVINKTVLAAENMVETKVDQGLEISVPEPMGPPEVTN
tara:strand:+ start:952 stop:1095 length:144 start_codon:yes stop_codon:yes gene_type:complete